MAEETTNEREYLVLYEKERGSGWIELARYKASTPRKAIEQGVTAQVTNNESTGVAYVAVPDRHWRPEQPTAKPVVSVSFGG